MKEKREQCVWGPVKKKQNERGQANEQSNLIERPAENAWFVCNVHTPCKARAYVVSRRSSLETDSPEGTAALVSYCRDNCAQGKLLNSS